MLVSFIGFFSLLLAPVVGMAISEVVRFVIQRRRNRVLFKLVGATVFIGGMVSSIPLFVSFISGITYSVPGGTLLGLSALSLVWPLVYALLSSTTCYYRLAGLQLR